LFIDGFAALYTGLTWISNVTNKRDQLDFSGLE